MAATVLDDTFPGTNGDPWNATTYVTSVIGTGGGVVDIQTHKGRLLAGAQGTYNNMARAILRTAAGVNFAIKDGEFYALDIDLQNPVNEQFFQMFCRTTNNWGAGTHAPVTCVQFEADILNSQLNFFYYAGGAAQLFTGASGTFSTPFTFTAGVKANFHFVWSGTTYTCAVWLTGNSEPAPQLNSTFATPTTAAGGVQIGNHGGNAAVTSDSRIGELKVIDTHAWDLAGTAAAVFTAAGTLTQGQALAGTAAAVFTASGTMDNPTPPPASAGVTKLGVQCDDRPRGRRRRRGYLT